MPPLCAAGGLPGVSRRGRGDALSARREGCATYIRRYLISHFREPLDIASSSFGEAAAIFGGQEQLREGLKNVVRQYSPQLIGVATTCLTETIGEDIGMYIREIAADKAAGLPTLVHVSTPSYANTHEEGYHAAVRALVETLAEPGPTRDELNLLAPLALPADLRWLKGVLRDFGLAATLLPDNSDTLDGPTWNRYQNIPPGGTPIAAIRRAGSAREHSSSSPCGKRAKRRAPPWRAAAACRGIACRCPSE